MTDLIQTLSKTIVFFVRVSYPNHNMRTLRASHILIRLRPTLFVFPFMPKPFPTPTLPFASLLPMPLLPLRLCFFFLVCLLIRFHARQRLLWRQTAELDMLVCPRHIPFHLARFLIRICWCLWLCGCRCRHGLMLLRILHPRVPRGDLWVLRHRLYTQSKGTRFCFEPNEATVLCVSVRSQGSTKLAIRFRQSLYVIVSHCIVSMWSVPECKVTFTGRSGIVVGYKKMKCSRVAGLRYAQKDCVALAKLAHRVGKS